MQIEFFDIMADEGWEPLKFNQHSPTHFWGGGGSMADAPVDIEATFDGAMWKSTRVDADFNMSGIRYRPNLAVPPRSHNLRQLIIVMGGELKVEWGDAGRGQTIGLGEFFISPAGAKFTTTAGSEGVSYIETWPVWVELQTTWYDGDGWVTR